MFTIGKVISVSELDNNKFIIKKIIEGGMGKVLLCKSLNPIMPDLAIKLIKSDINQETIIRESKIWTSLGVHPYIAEIISTGNYEGKFFLATIEYQGTLDTLIEKKYDDKELFNILINICNALKYANEKIGLLHRDIKPSNIYLDKDKNPKIADFGLSQYIEDKIEIENKNKIKLLKKLDETSVGCTLPFTAPEVLFQGKYSMQSDIFSLGITFFYIITNRQFPYINGINIDFQYTASIQIFIKTFAKKYPLVVGFVLKSIKMDTQDRWKSYDEIFDYYGIKKNKNYKYNIEEYIVKIQLQRKLKKYDLARYYIEEGISIFGNHPLLVNQLGISYLSINKMKKAIEVFSEYLKNKNTYQIADIEILFNLFNIYLRDRNPLIFELFQIIEKLLLNYSEILFTYYETGIYYLLKGNDCISKSILEYYNSNKNPNEYSLYAHIYVLIKNGIKREELEEIRRFSTNHEVTKVIDMLINKQNIQQIYFELQQMFDFGGKNAF